MDVVVAGFEEVVDDDEEEEEDEATPGRHCEYQGFEKTHVYPDTQVVGPVQSIPPHLPHAPAWANIVGASSEATRKSFEAILAVEMHKNTTNSRSRSWKRYPEKINETRWELKQKIQGT